MKKLAIVLAVSMISGVALADSTTVVHGPYGDKTVIKKSEPDVVVKKRVETTGTVGCTTKSVEHTNDFGDKVKKTKSNC